MFDDKRSKKVVLVAHCVLNQSVKIDRCAHYPGAISDVVTALMDAGIGLIQMPCPELLYLGLDRQADPTADTTIESEDTRVAERMAEPAAQTLCQQLAANQVYQIAEYQQHGFEVVGVIGINGSPTCGVEIGWADDQEQSTPGVFIGTLLDALAEKGMTLPVRGIKAYQPGQSAATIQELLAGAIGSSAPGIANPT